MPNFVEVSQSTPKIKLLSVSQKDGRRIGIVHPVKISTYL